MGEMSGLKDINEWKQLWHIYWVNQNSENHKWFKNCFSLRQEKGRSIWRPTNCHSLTIKVTLKLFYIDKWQKTNTW